MESEGSGGPPTGEGEHIPSNLEVEESAWFSNVYTFSPVWKPSSPAVLAPEMEAMRPELSSIREEGLAAIEHCYDSVARAVRLTVTFKDVVDDAGELPWIALGYRKDEECLMNPRDGGNSDMILLTTENGDGDVPAASFGPLLRTTKSFDSDTILSVNDGLVPLSEAKGFSNVDISLVTYVSPSAITSRSAQDPESVRLSFMQSMDVAPEAMHLMYAVGTSSQLGYHGTRMCFELRDFLPCGTKKVSDTTNNDASNIFEKYTNGDSSRAGVIIDSQSSTSTSSASSMSSGLLSVLIILFATFSSLN